MSKYIKVLERAQRDRVIQEGNEREKWRSIEEAPPKSLALQEATPSTEAGASAPPVATRETEAVSVAPKPSMEVDGKLRARMEEHLVSLLNPKSFGAEQYRVLRHVVEGLRKDTGLHVVAVTSPAVGEGKTTTTINLAGALAQSPNARVLLIDSDVRHPSVMHQLGMADSNGAGLVDAIINPALTLKEVEIRIPSFNLSVVSAGQQLESPYEIFKSPRLGELLDEARQSYEYIILDTPPLVPVPDCRVIGEWVDGFLVVVTAETTQRKLLEEALNIMDPAKVVGLVFNGEERPLSGYYGSYAAYHYTNGNGNGRKKRLLGKN